MSFETSKDVLDWYEKQPRTLTDEFISNIRWQDVKKYELDERFVPVLLYMRDVEVLTDMYYEELRRTPTGKDPIISKFMERWGIEEVAHGEVLNRFLNEAGIETDKKWKDQVRKSVSMSYTVNNYLIGVLTNLVGKKFTATHMAFGAIHEMTTGQGYRRLMNMANHPVLTEILTAIMREESAHTKFYWSMAKIELQQSKFARKIARSVIGNFYTPVGQGSLPKSKTDYLIRTLFNDQEGLDGIERMVSDRVQKLPGFDGLTKVGDHIRRIVSSNRLESTL